MNMTLLLLAISVGIIAGTVFYGGLWWTVQRIQIVRSPALLVTVSFFVRSFLTIAMFYALMALGDDVLALGVALVAFMAVRVMLTGRIRAKENRYAVES